ncbi:MAG: Rhomboid protease GluP [Verrucomicrobia subdivision 3 bacterium]|nr:Rhomboid protease GluP [Limisphaerales bacterium]MCS1412367.1 Rhomboid protease GluP [Limisphaerales bacterium]
MRSLQDAMDCSLALTSQEIENAIDTHEVLSDRYQLTVGKRDYQRALKIIERFREENRRWRWQQPFAGSKLVFRWSSLIWCLVLGAFGYLPVVKPAVLAGGILDSASVFEGEWWRIVTATMLHRDVAHLFSNLSAGFVLFGLVMGRYGIGVGLLGVLLTGIGGNLFGLAFHENPYRGLGASGAVMGGLGMLGPHAVGLVREDKRAYRVMVSSLLAVAMLFVLFGLSPDSDVIAHLGGFFTGITLGVVLGFVDEIELKTGRWNLLCSLGILGILLWAWGAALAGHVLR